MQARIGLMVQRLGRRYRMNPESMARFWHRRDKKAFAMAFL
jgi:hypothetical protein